MRNDDLARNALFLAFALGILGITAHLVKRRRRTPLQAGGACEAPPHKDGTISI